MARVASQNLFEILGDDDDIEAKVGLSNDTTPTKNETVVVQKHVDRSRASPKESRLRHEYPQFGKSDNRSGPRDLNVGRRHQDNDNNYNNNNYQSRGSRGSRPGERDRGRGGRRGGGGRGGGREFDRHSGSGRYNNEKNESKSWESNNADWGNNYRTNSIDKIDNNDNSNAFSSGWEPDNNGNAADDSSAWNVTESQEPTGEWGSNDQNGDGGDGGGGGGDWDAGKVETPSWEIQDEPTFEASGADNKNNKDLGEDEAATKPVETEEVVKTLEEYLSEKAQKVLDISLPEVRKPNEGVDDSQWKDAVPLEKKEDGDILFSGKEYSFKIKNKTKKSKNFLEIKPTFDKPVGFQRGGRGGGGRGRGRGGGGDRNRDDYDNRDNRRGDGGGERRSYDNNRDNRRGDGGGERSYDNNRDNRRGGGGGERTYDNYNNNRRGGERSYDGYNNRENRRGGNGNRSNYVNIDDQGAFPSLGTV